jgi:hypothetical protein
LKAQKAAWRKANVEKIKEQKAAWNKANAEKLKAQGLVYYAANAVRIASRKAAYRKANLDLVKQQSIPWRKANPDKIRALNNARKALVLKRTALWADTEAIRLVYLDAATHPATEQMHVDHIVPLRGKLVSGLHVANNLQVLPGTANQSKSAKFDPWTHVHEVRHHG